jgi:hypothetical protein
MFAHVTTTLTLAPATLPPPVPFWPPVTAHVWPVGWAKTVTLYGLPSARAVLKVKAVLARWVDGKVVAAVVQNESGAREGRDRTPMVKNITGGEDC